MNQNNYCVIMAGGMGTRFWPLSRINRPKQFIDILGTGKTLIQQTFERFAQICPIENIYIVTNEQYKDLVKTQLPTIDESQIVCEPMRRNTAPCIAYANYKIYKRNPNANIVVAPSDHVILKEEEFIRVVNVALAYTEQHSDMMTIGIHPTRPDTGYGYIQFDEEQKIENSIYRVRTFTEKPILEMAQQFLASGDFVWNAGIFVWKLPTIMEAFKQHLPEIDVLFNAEINNFDTPEETAAAKRIYEVCKNISIDYGVMEKAKNVCVISADLGWSDLGTWGSLFAISEKDANQNVTIGQNIMLYNTSNCIVNVADDKLIVVEGIEDCIVTENEDVLLICKKQEEQQIRQIVMDVQEQKGEKYI